MLHDATGIPAELHLTFDATPSIETRRSLADAIDEFHARTVPQDAQRFALLLRDDDNQLAGGLSGQLSGSGCSSRRCGSAMPGNAGVSGERY